MTRCRHPRRTPRTAVATIALVVLAGCGGDVEEAVDDVGSVSADVASSIDDDTEQVQGRTDTVAAQLEAEGLSTLASAVAEIDIAAIAGSDTFTLFAPEDDAFLEMTADELADMVADPDQLQGLLEAHLVAETMTAADLAEATEVTTVAGTTLAVSSADDTVTVGGATVTTADVTVGDGVVHVVDQVLDAG